MSACRTYTQHKINSKQELIFFLSILVLRVFSLLFHFVFLHFSRVVDSVSFLSCFYFLPFTRNETLCGGSNCIIDYADERKSYTNRKKVRPIDRPDETRKIHHGFFLCFIGAIGMFNFEFFFFALIVLWTWSELK